MAKEVPIFLDPEDIQMFDLGEVTHVRPRASRRIKAFPWYGSKYSHMDWLLPRLPEANHYVEPFGGSAAVLLNRAPSKIETYNDIDGNVVNFFKVLRENRNELLELLKLTPFSREEFMLAIQGRDQGNPVERARQFYILTVQTFVGKAQSPSLGDWRKSKTVSRNNMALATSSWLSSMNYLPVVADRLMRVQIENRPAMELIESYDKEDVLFYCDPPYPHDSRSAHSFVYYTEMSEQEHRELAELLSNVKAKVAISGYNDGIMSELYSEWELFLADPKYARSSKDIRQEALWTNYGKVESKMSLF